jgi:hypothetical protein
MKSERILVGVLRGIGIAAMLAIVPVFMPHAWMDQIHDWLGLGELPRLPVVVYLTRSLSALYVFHGVVLWFIADDVRRNSRLVTVVGLCFLGFGVVLLWIDVHAGLPWYWIALEGPASLFFGAIILVLQRRI